MLILFETPAGYALFKVKNDAKIQDVDNIYKEFATAESSSKLMKLQGFHRFKNTSDALKATTSLLDGKLSKSLKKFLTKEISDKESSENLGISDPKLGGLINKKLDIKCVHDNAVEELIRGIRSQLTALVSEVTESEMKAMSLGLSHSLSRYKLKFSPDKVDTMIIQAIALLDDLDKELNTYAMRVREWYGWHFPESSKIIPDNILFAKTVKKMGIRTNCVSTDFSDFLPEELYQELKEAAIISMGTEVSDEDIENITALCDQVVSISEYRDQLYEYLKNRMQAIAPNLTIMVGELVGARLIAHAGSLLNLAKHPASTVQILGAEKALFRALKTKHETPKYGLIYHASLIGQAPPKLKGKISRVLAAKTSLAVRCDSFGEGESNTDIGVESRAKVENRLRSLEGGASHKLSGTGKNSASKFEKYNPQTSNGSNVRPSSAYNTSNDVKINKTKKEEPVEETEEAPKKKVVKKEKPKKKDEEMEEAEEEAPKIKKEKKKSKKESNGSNGHKAEEEEKPKKKKRKASEETEEVEAPVVEKKKKKKSKE